VKGSTYYERKSKSDRGRNREREREGERNRYTRTQTTTDAQTHRTKLKWENTIVYKHKSLKLFFPILIKKRPLPSPSLALFIIDTQSRYIAHACMFTSCAHAYMYISIHIYMNLFTHTGGKCDNPGRNT